MPCFSPAVCWKVQFPGKGITFRSNHKSTGARIAVPCGQCIGCRLDRARDWATRIHHEASLHADNCFITLTFSDEHFPWDGSVSVRDIQLFMKRLRKLVGKVRFFACGEYGDDLGRPHYHLIIFGHAFPDKTPWQQRSSGHVTYRSATLEKLWPFGFSEIGTVTHQSAGYVARYVTKKINGRQADEHYTRAHPFTGQINRVRSEFIVMSNRPGIGSDWYDKYASDAFPSDFLIIEGNKVPVPRYYAKKIEGSNLLEEVKMERETRAKQYADNNTPERLATRQELQELRANKLIRKMETEQ